MLASHVVGAVIFAVFVACAAEATRRWPGWLAALVFPTFEVAFYFSLSLESPHGTWGSPAYSQVDFREFVQTASWLGMCGVMFIMSLLPSGLAVAWYRRRWNMDWRAPAIMGLSVFAVAILLGWIRVILAPTKPSVRVAMVASENLIPESESTDATDAADVMTQYAKLVRQVAVNGTQVVVLPEKIIGVAPDYEWDVVQGFQRIASLSHVWLVVGINHRTHAEEKCRHRDRSRRQDRRGVRQASSRAESRIGLQARLEAGNLRRAMGPHRRADFAGPGFPGDRARTRGP